MIVGAGVLSVCLGSGCANWKSVGRGNDRLFAVKTDSTAFYTYSPRQGNGPDKTIARNTPLRLLRPSFEFCKVRLLTGEEGYVANGDIAEASAELAAAAEAPKKVAMRAADPVPRFDVPPEPLPEFEPTPIPAPAD
jgi:hypothetical protein